MSSRSSSSSSGSSRSSLSSESRSSSSSSSRSASTRDSTDFSIAASEPSGARLPNNAGFNLMIWAAGGRGGDRLHKPAGDDDRLNLVRHKKKHRSHHSRRERSRSPVAPFRRPNPPFAAGGNGPVPAWVNTQQDNDDAAFMNGPRGFGQGPPPQGPPGMPPMMTPQPQQFARPPPPPGFMPPPRPGPNQANVQFMTG
jgi:hypothetical protein